MPSLSDEQWEFTQDVSRLISFAAERGFKLTMGEVYRTVEQQAIYVKSGLSKTMNSMHLNRCAVDFNIFFDIDGDGDKDLIQSGEVMERHARILGNYWKSLNSKNVSGFDWGWDYGHFERRV